MASLNQAVSQAGGGYQTANPTGDTGIGGFKYQAAQIETPKTSPSTMHQIFDQFIATAAPIAKGVVEDREKSAKDDYLVKKAQLEKGDITQQEFNDWVNNGDVWYKDNPFARKVARQDLGLQGRHEADAALLDDMKQNPQNYPTRQSLADALQQRRKQATDDYAKLYGIAPDDEDFLKGIGNGIVDSDIAIHEGYSQMMSERQKNSDQNVASVNLNGLITDNTITDPKTKAAAIAASHNRYNTNGVFYNTDQQSKALLNTVNELSAQPNGGALVREFGEQEVNVGGKMVKVKDVIGSDIMQKATVTGDTSTTRLDNDLNTRMSDELEAINNLPTGERDGAIAAFEKKYPQAISTSGEQTPWTQKLQAVRDKAQSDRAQELALADKQKADALKEGRGASAMQANFDNALRTPGGQINLDSIPWDTTTMGDKRQAYANEANRRMQLIDADNTLSVDQKNEKKLALLNADRVNSNGAVMSQFNGVVSGAVGEYHGMVMNEDPNAPHPNMDNLVSMYKTNPMAVRQILSGNKDGDELLSKLDTMNQLHYSLEDMLKADNALAKMTQPQRDAIKKTSTDNLANNANFTGIPLEINAQSQKVFELTYARTGGNTQAATSAQEDYVNNHTTFFRSGAIFGKGDDHGSVPSQVLMVNNDSASVPVVQEKINSWIKTNTTGLDNCTVHWDSSRNTIEVFDSQTGKSKFFTRGDIEKFYQDQQEENKKAIQEEHEKAKAEREKLIEGQKQWRDVNSKTTPAQALGFG